MVDGEPDVEQQQEVSRRAAGKMLAMSAIFGSGFTISTETVSADSGTISNEHISVVMDDNGTFQLQTSDDQQLTYPDADTSGLTVQVDGTNYVVGTPPGTDMGAYRVQDTQFSEDTTVATTEWELPEGVRVTQQISLAGEAARFQVSVENISNQTHDIRVRYLHDYQVGPQDGAPIFINGDVLTTERRFESPTFSSWQTYDQLPNPSLTGEGTITTTPTKIEFVAWEDASNSGYEYEGFDPDKDFYTSGETTSPASDSAGLLYFNLGTVSPGEAETIVTSYGVGPPAAAGVGGLDQALVDYRNAVTEYLDAVIEAKAEGYASQYLREVPDGAYGIPQADRSEVFRNSIVRFFKFRAGEASKDEFDPEYFDDIRALERTIPDDLPESEYEEIFQFADSMFEAVPPGDPDPIEDDARRTFRQYLLGEGEEQEETLTVGGRTLGEVRDRFVREFDRQRQQLIETCRGEELDPATVSTLVSRVNRKASQIDTAASKWAESYRGVTAAALEGEQMFTKAEAATIGGGIGSVVGAGVGLGVGLLLAGPTGEEPFLMGIGKGIGGVAGSGLGIVVGLVAAEAQEGGNRWSREFAGTETWKAITAFEVQWLYHLKRAPDRILPGAMANYAGDDAADRTTTVPETLFEAGCADAPELVDLDVEIEGIDVSTVSEEDRLGNSELAKSEGTVTIRNPQSNDRAIRPTFLRDECTVSANSTAAEVQRAWMTIPPRSELPEIQPGERADIGFAVVMPLRSNADYSVSLLVNASPLSTTTQQATTVVTHTVGTAEAVTTERLSDGLLPQGQSDSASSTVDDASQASFDLTYGGSDLDLHLYDADGSHVGRNYETGEYENGIPMATGSGPDQGTGYESIEISDAAGTYRTDVIAVSTPDNGSGFLLTNTRSESLPPSMDVVQSDVDVSVEPGETVETTLIVRETAGNQGLSGLSVESSTLSRDGGSDTIEDISIDPTTRTVTAGGRETVELAISAPQGATPGEYEGTLTVTHSQRSVALPVTVVVRGQRPEDGTGPGWVPFAIGGAAATGLLGYRYLSEDSSEESSDPW